MNSRIGKLTVGALPWLTLVWLPMVCLMSASADETPVVQAETQVITTAAEETPPAAFEQDESAQSVLYQEQRIGGRLERVTITRKNGLNEVYRNNRSDSIWSAQEDEIGDTPNMREWTIGSW